MRVLHAYRGHAAQPTASAHRARAAPRAAHSGSASRPEAPSKASRRSFLFVPYGERFQAADPSVHSICCDGLVQGAGLHLTHWTSNATPSRFYADLSADIAARFVASPEASGYSDAVVVNNHYDTDGVLSIFTLLHPEAAAPHAALLSAAAAVGDFEEWATLDSATEQALYRTGDAAVKLDLALKALGDAAGGDAAAYAAALEALPQLLAPGGLAAHEALWRPAYDQLCAAWAELQSPTGALQARRGGRGGRVGIVTHAPGAAEVPGPALSRAFGGPHAAPPRTLLAFAQPGGITWHYRWELPRHCWARTVSRPTHTPPDAAALSLALDAAARSAAAHEAAAAAQAVRNWAADGLPGMTGVLRTRTPLAASPSAVAAALERADEALAADARAQQQPAAPPPQVWGAAAYAR